MRLLAIGGLILVGSAFLALFIYLVVTTPKKDN